jgi:Acyltransferase family.
LVKCGVIYFKGESVPLYVEELFSHGVLGIFWNSVPYLNTPANVPLWFVRDLMIIMILSPIIYFFVKYIKIYGIILLFGLYIFDFWPSITGFSVMVYAFFSLGAYFSINKIKLLDICKKYKLIWYLFTLVLIFPLIWYNSYNNPIFGYKLLALFRITGVFALFHLSFYIVRNMKIKTLPILHESSFFLYATHMIYILFTVDIVLNKVIPSTATMALIVKYFLCPIICSFVCIGIYWVLKKYLPVLLNILTGRVRV